MGNGLATFSLPANSISNPSPLLCCQIWRNPGAGNHDEIDKRDWQCTGIDLSSLSLNANGGIYQSADLVVTVARWLTVRRFLLLQKARCDGGSGT